MTRNSDRRWPRVTRTAIAGAFLLWGTAVVTVLGAAGAAQERSVWEGVYTDAQATRGGTVFVRGCAGCHSDRPGGTAGDGTAPSLIGDAFTFRWIDSSVRDLFDSIRQTMPEAAPNSLSPGEYADLTAYILKLNNYPSGSAALDPADSAGMGRIFIVDGP